MGEVGLSVWDDLHRRLGLADKKDLVSKWWEVLERHYGHGEGEGGRYYHSLHHVAALLHLCTVHRAVLQRKELVELAVFFHDVIYDGRATDNEERSARLFEQYADEVGLGAQEKKAVYKWIIDTKTHTSADTQGDEDEAYFLDFDLSVLGENEERYDEYAAQIRQEYAHIPDDAFHRGRADVLEGFLQVPSLFRTAKFKETREAKAVRREIERLREAPAP